MFEKILDKDEQSVEVLIPNKTKFFVKTILVSTLYLLFFVAVACLGMFVPSEGFEPLDAIWVLVPIGAFILFEVLVVIFACMWYKKTFYAYTNKRVIMRTGVIGVDYKSLDIKMIGAIDVYVSFFDKLVHKDTGSLRFGSMSSPINGQASAFIFSHIEKPYENYKKIKEFIEEQKKIG